MSRALRADYSQQDMFPARLEDWVGEDHPARFIREFVDALDLSKLGFRKGNAEPGRPHYGSDLLLKAWIYGYMNKIRSSRELEKATREHLSLIWLMGKRSPDHNTLWRFWRENQKALRGVFREGVRVACRTGMVGLVLHAVDGTRIEAVDSTARACRGKHLRKTLQKVDKYIQELEKAIERGQQEETGSYSLPEQLQDRRRLRQRILEELEKAEQDQPASDARIQKIGGKKLLGFNAQAMVDSENQLIVAEEVVSEETDFKQLGPLLDQTEENVGAVAEDTVADRGYRSDRGIAEAQEKGRSVLVRLYDEEINPGPYHWTRFEYDPDKDVCVCPRGEALTRVGGYWDKRRDLEIRTYRCRVWEECPVASQCSRDPRGRKIRLTQLQPYILDQQARQREARNQVKLRRRKEIVERSFAEIKQHMGFRRWSYREIEGVQTQWAMICTAYNLKRLLKTWARGRLKWAVA